MLKKLKIKLIEIVISFNKKFYLLSAHNHLNKIYNFFSENENFDYILVKKSKDFPLIKPGSDFDLYVSNESEFANLINSYFKKYDKYETKYVNSKIGSLQVDLYYKDKFLYKFDLMEATNVSKLFSKSFVNDSLIKKEVFSFIFKGKKMSINVPNNSYENLIRFIEQRLYPNKIHHLVYLDKLSDDQKKELKVMVKKYTNI